jgi:hypothetical protein
VLGRRQRQEVGERAVAELAAEAQHAVAQRGDRDRHRLRGRRLEPEAARSAAARQHLAQHGDGLAQARERHRERDRVPALDDHVRRRAEPEHEAPAAGVGERRRVLGEHGRPARVRVHDARAEPHPLGPGRGQRERGEPVGAVRLAGPQVVVAGRLGAPHERLVVRQRHAGERKRQTPT